MNLLQIKNMFTTVFWLSLQFDILSFLHKKNRFMLWSPWDPRRGVRKELGGGESGLTLIVSAEWGKGVGISPSWAQGW